MIIWLTPSLVTLVTVWFWVHKNPEIHQSPKVPEQKWHTEKLWWHLIAKNIIWCIWCTQFELKKKHYFPHTVHYCCSSMPRFSETCQFLTRLIVLRSKACSDWPAIQCVVIGRIPQACDRNVTPLHMLWCHVPGVVPNSAPCQIMHRPVLVGLGVGVGEGLGLGNQVAISMRGCIIWQGCRFRHNTGTPGLFTVYGPGPTRLKQ